jgi:glycine C-acetyltransferase
MYGKMKDHLQEHIDKLKSMGSYREEYAITGRQGPVIKLEDGRELLNLCSNNYLGLSGNQDIIDASKCGMERWGFGLSATRPLGTQGLHQEVERRVSEYLGTEDTVLYISCYAANLGLFGTLLEAEDAIITDALNHASIIDGIRLCAAKRYRYKNNDMADLETKLQEASGDRFRLIATDGVFSMDGYLAKLPEICDLAEKYDAIVMIDDSHATGIMGPNGKGSPEHFGVMGRIDIITSTFGKALGGACGGFTTGRKEIIQTLRQASRTYVFSNALPPGVGAAVLKVLDLLKDSSEQLEQLRENHRLFRNRLTKAGFELLPGDHPIVPVMLRDTKVAMSMARRLNEVGVYAIAVPFPAVPRGEERIRVQISAAFSREQIEKGAEAFIRVGREMGIIKPAQSA